MGWFASAAIVFKGTVTLFVFVIGIFIMGGYVIRAVDSVLSWKWARRAQRARDAGTVTSTHPWQKIDWRKQTAVRSWLRDKE